MRRAGSGFAPASAPSGCCREGRSPLASRAFGFLGERCSADQFGSLRRVTPRASAGPHPRDPAWSAAPAPAQAGPGAGGSRRNAPGHGRLSPRAGPRHRLFFQGAVRPEGGRATELFFRREDRSASVHLSLQRAAAKCKENHADLTASRPRPSRGLHPWAGLRHRASANGTRRPGAKRQAADSRPRLLMSNGRALRPRREQFPYGPPNLASNSAAAMRNPSTRESRASPAGSAFRGPWVPPLTGRTVRPLMPVR